MRKRFIAILLAMLILVSAAASAATIKGSVYDLNLNKVNGVIIEVNSTPKQRFVSANGTYSFNLNDGSYMITAKHNTNGIIEKTQENITVSGTGEFVLDLFLYPDITNEEDILNPGDIDSIQQPYENSLNYLLFIAIAFAIFVAVASFILFSRKNGRKTETEKAEKSEDQNLEKIIALLKKHDGRLTQKDIRKEMPLSEAKISLMISELEHEGKIKRIKKGRGNIILLSKR